ncbi:MAG: four-helix bundle copper-binding protein [Pseudomonadota bacterium]
MSTLERPALQTCIDLCQKCHNLCLASAMNRCLEAGGKNVEPGHFRLLVDCAAACQATADFMLRQSEFHEQSCLDCATLCDYCAHSCRQVGGMSDVADMCRECADSCHQMALATA